MTNDETKEAVEERGGADETTLRARLSEWAKKNLDVENDWVKEKNGAWLLRLEACERLAQEFGISVEDVKERDMEWRDIPETARAKWPDGWTKEPVATVFVTVKSADGRIAIRGGKFSGSEVDEVDGKYDPGQLTDHSLFALAHSRAYRLAVRQAIGGFDGIEPEGAPPAAQPEPHRCFFQALGVSVNLVTGEVTQLVYAPCPCGATWEPPKKAPAVPAAAPEPEVVILTVDTPRSGYQKGGWAIAGEYLTKSKTYIRRGFSAKHVLRIDKSVGLQGTVARWLFENGCERVVLDWSGDADRGRTWYSAPFIPFILNAKERSMNPADGLQVFAPLSLFEEVPERPEWLQDDVRRGARVSLPIGEPKKHWWS